MRIDLGVIAITNGSLLNIDLKCVPAEKVEILGMGLARMPMYFDYKMLKNCYQNTHHNKLKYILELLETGDTRNCVIRFV